MNFLFRIEPFKKKSSKMERSPPNYVKLATTNAAAAAAQQRNERVVLTPSGELNYPGQVKWAPRPAVQQGAELKKPTGTTKIITVGIDGNLKSSVMTDNKDFLSNISGAPPQVNRSYGQADWSTNRNSAASTSYRNESSGNSQTVNQWISSNVNFITFCLVAKNYAP